MAYGYEITQEDIDGVIRFLKIAYPDQATPEVARIALEFNQDMMRDLAEADEELATEVARVLANQSVKRAEKWAKRDRN